MNTSIVYGFQKALKNKISTLSPLLLTFKWFTILFEKILSAPIIPTPSDKLLVKAN